MEVVKFESLAPEKSFNGDGMRLNFMIVWQTLGINQIESVVVACRNAS